MATRFRGRRRLFSEHLFTRIVQPSAQHHNHMSNTPAAYDPRNGWLRALHMMIEAMGSSRPFVHLVMRQLQGFVKQQLESRGCVSDCSTGHDIFDDGPAELEITGVTADGVFTTNQAHSFMDDQRVQDPVAIYFKNVPEWLADAGVVEGATM
jgi:hypothetical protein